MQLHEYPRSCSNIFDSVRFCWTEISKHLLVEGLISCFLVALLMLLIAMNYISLSFLTWLLKTLLLPSFAASSLFILFRWMSLLTRRLFSNIIQGTTKYKMSPFLILFSSFLLGTGTSTAKDPGLGKLRAIMPPYHVATTANTTKHQIEETIYIFAKIAVLMPQNQINPKPSIWNNHTKSLKVLS